MNILVRTPNWLGDCVVATAAVVRLVERMPEASIDVWVRPSLSPLFSNLGAQVRSLPAPSGLRGLRATSRALRSSEADAALLLAPSIRAGLEAAFARVPIRVGYPDDHRRVLLTHPVVRCFPEGRSRAPFGRHIWLEGLELAERLADALQAPAGREQLPLPVVCPPPEAVREAETLLERCSSARGRPLIGINPLSRGGITRDWPLERYAELIQRLRRRLEADILLFGGPAEGAALTRLEALCKEPVATFAGATALPLLTFAAVASRLSVLVTNDTGPMHLAAAIGGRVVAIFGSTRPDLTGPVGEGHRCLHIPALPCAGCYRRRCPFNLECLTGTSVDAVTAAVEEMLSNS